MGIPATVYNKIKAMYEAGYTCDVIAKTLGVPESTVRSIVNR